MIVALDPVYPFAGPPWDKSPYSESARLYELAGQNSKIQDRIDRITGVIKTPRESIAKFKRPKRPNNYYRKLAFKIFDEVCGVGIPWMWFTSPGKLDWRQEWVLNQIYLIEHDKANRKKYYFLRTVAKDAGVWPPPKWWRVKRIMQRSRIK